MYRLPLFSPRSNNHDDYVTINSVLFSTRHENINMLLRSHTRLIKIWREIWDIVLRLSNLFILRIRNQSWHCKTDEHRTSCDQFVWFSESNINKHPPKYFLELYFYLPLIRLKRTTTGRTNKVFIVSDSESS